MLFQGYLSSAFHSREKTHTQHCVHLKPSRVALPSLCFRFFLYVRHVEQPFHWNMTTFLWNMSEMSPRLKHRGKTPSGSRACPSSVRNLHLHGFPVGNLPHTKAALAQARTPTPSEDEVCCRSLPGHPDTRASSAHCDFSLPAEQRAASDCILSGYPGFCSLMTIWTVERRLPPPSSCSQRGEMKRGLTWKNFNQ